MRYWLQAEKDLSYRVKQEMHWKNITEEEARKILEPEIRISAFFLYNAAKNNPIDYWLKAKEEYYKQNDFYPDTENYADTLLPFMPKIARQKYAQLIFISDRAYFDWLNDFNTSFDQSEYEKRILDKIGYRASEILKKQPYLSVEEAFNCARDQFYYDIQNGAAEKRKWVSERAYQIGEDNPNNSSEENWYIAEQEFDDQFLSD
ncbi:hypothetical protein [Methanomethylovorans hollandica]|uniref:hypothetical protein n=1 Tax=Methanomethylovorans hollandica TaxID=101192 RepID=UPI0006622A24|nr:hypothetical protein [Methanomethylovorans hollandica]